MTDEERQEIVRNLRNYHPSRVGNWTFTRAADELERLQRELREAERVIASLTKHLDDLALDRHLSTVPGAMND